MPKPQPVPPTDVVLFLESERGRMEAELSGGSTSSSRKYIDEIRTDYAQGLYSADEDSDESIMARALLHTAFVFNTLHKTLTELTGKNAYNSDTMEDKYRHLCGSLGGVLLHGLKVIEWRDRHHGESLRYENAIAAGLSYALMSGLSRRRIKIMGSMLVEQNRR